MDAYKQLHLVTKKSLKIYVKTRGQQLVTLLPMYLLEPTITVALLYHIGKFWTHRSWWQPWYF